MSANITPNEILQKKFSQSVRGLKSDEVYDFLNLIASEFEKLLRHNLEMSEKIEALEEATDEYRHMETTLRNTLVSSQRIVEEIKKEAERKSESIVRESELESERIIQKVKQRKERLEEETFQLMNQHKRFRAEFVSLLETHGKMIKAQDSRIMLEYGPKDSGNTFPSSEPEIETGEDRRTKESGFDDEGVKEMEILFPEEKE